MYSIFRSTTYNTNVPYYWIAWLFMPSNNYDNVLITDVFYEESGRF